MHLIKELKESTDNCRTEAVALSMFEIFIMYSLTFDFFQILKESMNITVKPVFSGHLKIDKSKVLMENGSLMKVESIAESSTWSILQYF